MRAILTHFRIRLHATLTDPWAAVMLVGACLPCIAIWPGPVQASGKPWLGYEAVGPLMIIAFMFGWPHFVASIPGGFDAGGKTGGTAGIHPMPTLPIGRRGRVFAEALIPLVIVLVIRIPGVFVIDWACAGLDLPRQAIGVPVFWARFVRDSLLGAVMILPMLIVIASPTNDDSTYAGKPFLCLAMIFGALKLGLLSGPIGCLSVGVLFSGLALLTVGRDLPKRCVEVCLTFSAVAIIVCSIRWGYLETTIGRVLLGFFLVGIAWELVSRRVAASRGPVRMWRSAARNPELQLRRDQWLQPLISHWPVILLAIGLQIAAVLLIHWPELPFLTFRNCTMFSALLLSLVATRPIGKTGVMLCSGLPTRGAFRCGDFAAAWSVLPVRQEKVLRGVYLHVLITGTAIWTMVLTANYYAGWLETGQLCLIDRQHEPIGWALLTLAAMIPCQAGLTTAAAVGDIKGMILSGAAGVALLPLVMYFVIGQAAGPITVTWLVVATAVGGLRPLAYWYGPTAKLE